MQKKRVYSYNCNFKSKKYANKRHKRLCIAFYACSGYMSNDNRHEIVTWLIIAYIGSIIKVDVDKKVLA